MRKGRVMPSFEYEDLAKGMVVGIDEAGRGPWAGPVVAGAVIFKTKNVSPYILNNLDDSKKLSAKKRESLYDYIQEEIQKGNILASVGISTAEEIDDINILNATFLAMKRAVDGLSLKPDFALIDGNQNPKDFPCCSKPLIKGDQLSFSISAASIVAKVYRDRLMRDLALKYPHYGFEKNAGYGTKLHIEGLKQFGITPEHRKSYKPIKIYL